MKQISNLIHPFISIKLQLIMNMVMPNFLILGAAKAGTTSLYYYLSQHPQIYMSPVKEPMFFALEGEKLNFQNPGRGINYNAITELEAYLKLFQNVTTEVAIGEASPLYLYDRKAPQRIKHYIPDAKLIVLLRNPVERAYSAYTHQVREKYEPLSFAEGLAEEKNSIRNNWDYLWHYCQAGYYYPQLKRYFDIFPLEQIRVYLYEDFQANSVNFVQNVYRFLGVDDTFIPDLTKMNVSGIPKSRFLHHLVNRGNWVRKTLKIFLPQQLRSNVAQKIREWNLKEKPQVSLEIKEQLGKQYEEDILKLQKLIQRDLSPWLLGS